MKRKCDNCDRPATNHSVEIVNGKKLEKHLCDQCAASEPGMKVGMKVKSVHTPINELLTTFVKMHSGVTAEKDISCESCGLSWMQFQETSVLGCPQCYGSFEPVLAPLLERAHEGATHHLGKTPRRRGGGEQRQVKLTRLRKRLDEAVTAEDYELAAHLRDEIQRFQEN